MPNVSTNDLRNGMALKLPEGLFTVVEFQHVKPGKGGAFVRTKLKNVRTGAVIDRTYRSDEKLEQINIDKREMQFLYREGTYHVFMDNTTYDQMHVPGEAIGDAVKYMKDGDSAVLQMYKSEIVGRDLELVVALVVHEDERGALAVEVLHLTLVDDGERDLLVGTERALEHGAGPEVLELGAHERAALARLHVLELDDGHEALGEVQGHAVLQVVGGDAHSALSGKPIRRSGASGTR